MSYNTLSKRINELAEKKRDLVGKIIGYPYLYTINTKEFWVADIDVGAGQKVLYHVPIAQYAYNLSHAEKDTPVRLQKDSAGLYQIVGRAEVQISNKMVYSKSIKDYGMLFAFGLAYDSSGKIVSSSSIIPMGNSPLPDSSNPPPTPEGEEIIIPDEEEHEEGYTFRYLTLGEISPLGDYKLGAYVYEVI